MSDNTPPNKDDAMLSAAKKGGKELLAGLSKAGLLFTKRMAEGAFNAQLAQSEKEDTTEKIKAAGSEIGRAFIKGALEGATESLAGLINAANTFNKEMSKYNDDTDPDQLPSS